MVSPFICKMMKLKTAVFFSICAVRIQFVVKEATLCLSHRLPYATTPPCSIATMVVFGWCLFTCRCMVTVLLLRKKKKDICDIKRKYGCFARVEHVLIISVVYPEERTFSARISPYTNCSLQLSISLALFCSFAFLLLPF